MGKPNPNTKPILEAYCQYVGNEYVYQMPKMMAAARNLANYGLQPAELPALLDWSKTTWAGREGTDLMVAQMVLEKWRTSGKPGAVTLTRDEQVRALRTSTDPKYLGSHGARLREREIQALMEDQGE